MSSTRESYLYMLRRMNENLPSRASIYRLYGNYADVRFGSSPSVVRNVEIIGDPLTMSVGQTVLIYWQEKPGHYGPVPVVLSTETSYGLDAGGIPLVDGNTIVYGPRGLQVPRGGIDLEHLSFTPSVAGHTHRDPLQEYGWHFTNDGILFAQKTYIHPTGQIVLGSDNDIIKLDSVHTTYRLWAGAVDPAAAPFSVQKTGAMKATAGTIAGWDIFSDRLEKNDVSINPLGYIVFGSGNNIVRIDSQHATYRIWSGNADPASAPFSVGRDGSLKATAGQIGGWTIYTDRLENASLKLDPDGRIEAGTGDDIAIIDAQNVDDYRLWIGASNPASAPFRVKKTGETWLTNVHVSSEMESTNYVSGQAGWHLDPTGWAEFQNVVIRGTLTSVVYAQETISVMSGTKVIAEGSALTVDVSPSDTTITVADPAFGPDYIIQIQPSPSRSEWMQITSEGTAVADGYQYDVTRALDDTAEPFYAGEVVIGRGYATYPVAAGTIGDPTTTFSEVAFGGHTFTAMGGYLTLEGENETGPYFGVAVRHGPVYNQIVDIARFGRLKNFIGVQDGHGVAIGDINQHMRYTYEYGLEVKTAGGKTLINNDGLSTEKFSLRYADAAPRFRDQFSHLWLDIDNRRIMANLKDGSFEEDAVVIDFENPDTIGVVFSATEPEETYPGLIWIQE